MCGIMADYDTVQNKIKNGYIFKVIRTLHSVRNVMTVAENACAVNCMHVACHILAVASTMFSL